MTGFLVAPLARARFVVTLPPEPSTISAELEQRSASSFVTLTDTRDAFLHLARRAQGRLVIMTPFIDPAGARWAHELFKITGAKERVLVLRNQNELNALGTVGSDLKDCCTRTCEYFIQHVREDGQHITETFHAKIVLADGCAAYVGSANFLYRSRETNLECGFLLDGDAVAPVTMLVEAVLAAV